MTEWFYNDYYFCLPKKTICQLLTQKYPKQEVLLLPKECFLVLILRATLKKGEGRDMIPNFWDAYTNMGAIAFFFFFFFNIFIGV